MLYIFFKRNYWIKNFHYSIKNLTRIKKPLPYIFQETAELLYFLEHVYSSQ